MRFRPARGALRASFDPRSPTSVLNVNRSCSKHAVDRRSAALQERGDLSRAKAGRPQAPCLLDLASGERSGPSGLFASQTCGLASCVGTLTYEGTLILGQAREYAGEHFAEGLTVVDAFAERAYEYPAFLEFFNRLDDVRHAPAQTVESHDDDRVAFPGIAQEVLEPGAFPPGSGHGVLEDSSNSDGFEGISLLVGGLL